MCVTLLTFSQPSRSVTCVELIIHENLSKSLKKKVKISTLHEINENHDEAGN